MSRQAPWATLTGDVVFVETELDAKNDFPIRRIPRRVLGEVLGTGAEGISIALRQLERARVIEHINDDRYRLLESRANLFPEYYRIEPDPPRYDYPDKL